MSKKYDEYMKSEIWKEISEKRKFFDGYKCVLCGSTKNLEVNHLIYDGVNTYGYDDDISNLITLCHSCHNKFHRYWAYKGNSEIKA